MARARLGALLRPTRTTVVSTIVLIAGQACAFAGTIIVTTDSGGTGGPECTLRDAITAANTDQPTGGCPAGNGADVIELPTDAVIDITEIDNQTNGNNGLPSITSDVTIIGHGATVRHADMLVSFRLFHISENGILAMEDCRVSRDTQRREMPDCLGSDEQDPFYCKGGGILNLGQLDMTLCTVSGHETTGVFNLSSAGGGIFNSGTAAMTDCSISDNGGVHDGGGIYNAGELILERCTVNGNFGIEGSAIFNTGMVSMLNCSITTNNGAFWTGVIRNDVSAVMTVTHSTVMYNVIGQSGNRGFSNGGLMTLRAVITDGCESAKGTAIDAGYNLGVLAKCFRDSILGGWPVGPLQDNGGPTLTRALLQGNPAIDAIPPGECTVFHDQRGVPRPSGAGCDIGAYEVACGDGFVDGNEDCETGACCEEDCTFSPEGTVCNTDPGSCEDVQCSGGNAHCLYCVEDYAMEAFARLESPALVAFDSEGTLYVGNGAPTGQVRIVSSDGQTVQEVGPVLSDPDSVVFDTSGAVGSPETILVGGDNTIRQLDPQTGMATVLFSGPPLQNIGQMTFDSNGKLLAGQVHVGAGVVEIDQGQLSVIFNQPGEGTAGVAIREDGSIFVSAVQSALIYRIDSSGDLIDDPFASIDVPLIGGGIAYASAGPFAGSLFAHGREGEPVYRIDGVTGDVSEFITGLEYPVGLAIGPQGDLFVSDYLGDAIYRVFLPCTTLADCADLDNDGVRDDKCTWWSCDAGACIATETIFADFGAEFGACPPDQVADANDRFHALNCFSNTDPNGSIPYPCEPDSPNAFNVDAGGPFGDCNPDGVCDGNDAFHVIHAFEGTTACSCSAEGGPAPEPVIVGEARLILEAEPRRVRPGGIVQVHVFIENPLPDLRGYQLHLNVVGGIRGDLRLMDIEVQQRKNLALPVSGRWEAFNVSTGQMVVGLDSAGVVTPSHAYLATFTYQASEGCSGTPLIEVADRSFLFGTSANASVSITKARPIRILPNLK